MCQMCMGQVTFDAIIKGELGSDYAQKANEIKGYNYSQAMTRGSVNLWLALDKDVRKINRDVADQNEKTEEIKEKIDATYKALERYKTVDAQENNQEE